MDNFTRKVNTYSHEYLFADDKGAGFDFPCDEQGNMINSHKAAQENYKKCLTGSYNGRKVIDMGVKSHVTFIPLCLCGSGKDQYPLYDARGIFCCHVCEDCEKEKRSRYRSDIFTDSSYPTNEEV